MWSLLTDEYDSMENHHPWSTESRPLQSTTFEEARDEALRLYESLPKYTQGYGGNKEYPCNPRLAFKLNAVPDAARSDHDMRHLRLSMRAQYDAGDNRHPQVAMRELGITYQIATPQSIADQWWFWNCENVPDVLPSYLTELNVTPEDAVGSGLTADDALAIRKKAQ